MRLSSPGRAGCWRTPRHTFHARMAAHGVGQRPSHGTVSVLALIGRLGFSGSPFVQHGRKPQFSTSRRRSRALGRREVLRRRDVGHRIDRVKHRRSHRHIHWVGVRRHAGPRGAPLSRRIAKAAKRRRSDQGAATTRSISASIQALTRMSLAFPSGFRRDACYCS